MKTRIKNITLLLIIIIANTLFAVQVNAEDGYIWAMKNPIAYEPLAWLDHTYACVDSYYNCYTSPRSASVSGGTIVVGGMANEGRATCRAYCTLQYGVDGVCHQHTNRVILDTGKTLNTNVRGYATSRWNFGTYGNLGINKVIWNQCVSSCNSSN